MSGTVLLTVIKAEQAEKMRRAQAERLARAAQQGKERPSAWKSLLLVLGIG